MIALCIFYSKHALGVSRIDELYNDSVVYRDYPDNPDDPVGRLGDRNVC